MLGEVPYKLRAHPFRLIYTAIFILSFHLFFVVYINSSFLSQFVGESYVGMVFTGAALLNILGFIYVPKILQHIGAFKTLLFLTFVEFFTLISFTFIDIGYIVIPLFALHSTAITLILYCFDILLENFTTDESATGTIRGTVLSLMNGALVLGPLIAGFVLTNGDYWKVYLISAFMLIPFLTLLKRFRNFKDPNYHTLKILPTIACIKGRPDLRNIFIVQFLMRVFFAWMIIYLPLFLHAHIGFSWTEIGIMTAIFLLPMVIFEYPIGKLADVIGERELLMLGFFIAGMFLLIFPITTAANVFFWTALVFMIRTGVSFVETLSETYFFRHVNGEDNNTISFFRITRPLSYVVGPLIGTIGLLFLDFEQSWILLGIIMLSGIYFSHKIHSINHLA